MNISNNNTIKGSFRTKVNHIEHLKKNILFVILLLDLYECTL